MKNIIIAIFCLISINLSAQDYDFAIGATFQPFFYKNYNKSDWNNMPRSYPHEPKIFNGYAIGLATDTPISDILSVKAELTYSKQNQKHISSAHTNQHTDGTVEYFYDGVTKTEYDILRLPLLLSYNVEIGFKRDLYFSVFAGPQVSYLLDYKFVNTNYDWDLENDQLSNDIFIETTYTPNNRNQIGFIESHDETAYLYNRWLWGAVAGLEFRKNISSNFSIGLGGRFEYDFTDSEKYPDIFAGFIKTDGTKERVASHNVRAGLSLNVMYLFD